MNPTIDRLKLIFLVIFAICCVGIWTYQALYVWPRNKCEAMGDWWDWRDRVCAVPMPIWRFTGRGIPQPETLVARPSVKAPPVKAPSAKAPSVKAPSPKVPPAKPAPTSAAARPSVAAPSKSAPSQPR
jgi:hypothetical protein